MTTSEVRRRLPSPLEGTAALAVTKFDAADLMSNSVKALWNRSICELTDIAGTENEITAECDPALDALSDTMSFRFIPTANNTGAVEISIGSVGPISIKNAAGDDLIADQLQAGTLYTLGHYSGELRIVGSDSSAGGFTSIFDTVALAVAAFMAPGSESIYVRGYADPGDGGAALYIKVPSEPSHAGKFQNVDGSWWELAEEIPTPEMFGAVGKGVVDDTAAVQAAFDSGFNLFFPGLYYITETITYSGLSRSFRGRGPTVSAFTSDQNIPYITIDTDVGDCYFNTFKDFKIKGINVGTKTLEAGIRIIGSSGNFFAHNTIGDLGFEGIRRGVVFDKNDNVGGEARSDWNRIGPFNTVHVDEVVTFVHGSGTGNVIGGGSWVFNTFGVQAGDGIVNAGDIALVPTQVGSETPGATGIKLRGGALYGGRITVTGWQYDANVDVSYDLDDIDRFKAVACSYGGASNWLITDTCTNIDLGLADTITPAQITSNQNNYNPTGLQFARYLHLNSDATRNITGMAGGFDGRIIEIFNNGAQVIGLLSGNLLSSAANRFSSVNDISLHAMESAIFRYVGATKLWVQIGLALRNTGVTNGAYASAGSNVPSLTIDAQGRITAAADRALVMADVGASPSPPQGRLTLQTGVPVMITTQAAKTTIYYTPYNGANIPLYDGAKFVMASFSEISIATTDTAKNPAAIGASKVNDWFVWNDAGTLRLSHGPDWTSDTARSAGTALVMQNGILLNSVSITSGPAASRGTYVGTTRSNASSQLDWILGDAGAGGVAAFLYVWNCYNRVNVKGESVDSTANYSYSSATIRAANASNLNRVSWVCGLKEDAAKIYVFARVATAAVANAYSQFGFALDSITNFSGPYALVITPTANNLNAMNSVAYDLSALLGAHFVNATEQGDGVNTNTMNSSATNRISLAHRM